MSTKQFTTQNAPEGYWIDAKGHLVPEHLVKEIDKQRDTLVGELVTSARVMSAALKKFKLSGFGDIEAFIGLSAEQYNVKLGGKKGNVTLPSFDGCHKVQRAIQEKITFDERLQAAKTLIDECLNDWTEGARPEIHTIISQAFAVDKEGNINTGAILALRRYDITDERWLRAMDAIGEAIQVTGSRQYIRVYERVGDNDQYQVIPLDIAGV
ncbi:DUF3164 family protein [Xenorhabdus cabanillasii]|uniref:Sulfate transporter n=1 Tax=Xenorhabdus cabanillasii JM26 TaxID=1427517 RepID=W1IR97_9GAMM|nr:DUF3164 family protein [Xenorhabdus cabanillasii]PHM78419.1 sulfate transporter [Xenorhabdus cabanillasii JM26]CDL79755.1 conserved hypothetical protein [Xenorhabdus cabanillasii JM26]